MHAWAAAMHPDTPQPSTTRLVDHDAPSSERTYAMLTHLSLIAAPAIWVPVVIPLIMWLVRRKDSPFLDDHGREAVNFQISLSIYALVFGLMSLCGIGLPLVIGVAVLGMVGSIMGAVAAHKGEFFRYPMSLRLV
jgi:uncharacterized Tic20 family protein